MCVLKFECLGKLWNFNWKRGLNFVMYKTINKSNLFLWSHSHARGKIYKLRWAAQERHGSASQSTCHGPATNHAERGAVAHGTSQHSPWGPWIQTHVHHFHPHFHKIPYLWGSFNVIFCALFLEKNLIHFLHAILLFSRRKTQFINMGIHVFSCEQ